MRISRFLKKNYTMSDAVVLVVVTALVILSIDPSSPISTGCCSKTLKGSLDVYHDQTPMGHLVKSILRGLVGTIWFAAGALAPDLHCRIDVIFHMFSIMLPWPRHIRTSFTRVSLH